MPCRLCLEEKNLIKAHIIPDFMYQELYDQNHSLYKVLLENPLNYTKIPTGEYDNNILCSECDNVRIGQLEDYAAKVFNEGLGIEFANFHYTDVKMTVTHVKKIDYKKFKLFLLSMLWRASVTTRESFRIVSLRHYEETIRQMLYKGDPKERYDFPCIMIAIRADVPWASQLIVPPTRIKQYFRTVYRFLMNGILYLFYIGEKINLPEPIMEGAISKTNEMRIFHVKKGEGEEILKKYLGFNRWHKVGGK